MPNVTDVGLAMKLEQAEAEVERLRAELDKAKRLLANDVADCLEVVAEERKLCARRAVAAVMEWKTEMPQSPDIGDVQELADEVRCAIMGEEK